MSLLGHVLGLFVLYILIGASDSDNHPNSCCEKVLSSGDAHSELIGCVNSSLASPKLHSAIGPTLSVVVVTRATESTHSYAAYSYFLQSQYARRNGYSLLPLTPDSSEADYEYHRKIVPLLDALDRYPHADYVVWMDADLIVLDFALRVEEVAGRHPSAHILISRDVSNLVNTGCMILRNTLWTRTFLREWLALKSNRRILNEQMGFDSLYEQYEERDRREGTSRLSRLAILPREVLNSIFPAMREQQPHHQVLHMATDSEVYRRTVFKQAATNYCRALRDGTSPPPQLGVSREYLQRTVLQINRGVFEGLETHILNSNPVTDNDPAMNDLISQYHDSVSKYCFAVAYQNGNSETSDTLALRKRAFEMVRKTVDDRLKYVVKYTSQYLRKGAGAEVTLGVGGLLAAEERTFSLSTLLPAVVKTFSQHVERVKSGETVGSESQLERVNAAARMVEMLPDIAKAAVELAFDFVQSIGSMGDDYVSFGYTVARIQDEQSFILDYILNTLEVMLELVRPKMRPAVEAMRSDFLAKCGTYCEERLRQMKYV